LCSNYKARNPGTVMMYFWKPLFLHVFKRGRRSYTKADQENICLWIGEGTKAIVILLTYIACFNRKQSNKMGGTTYQLYQTILMYKRPCQC
jgi:hypothetical protein